MRARPKAQSDVSCCSPFDDSTPPAPQVSNRATADDNWRRQKAQHTTHNVGMIVVTIARVLDGVFAASMRAPLKQAKLANEPRIVGQPRQTAREHRQAFEVDGAFRPRTADVFKLKFAFTRVCWGLGARYRRSLALPRIP